MPRPPSGPPVQVVWFKKDLRVRDHAPLIRAAERGPVLPLYLYEPEQLHHEEFAGHHLTYLNGCLAELDERLRVLGTPLVVRRGEAVAVLEELSELVPIGGLWAHEETGNGVSYGRDRRVRAWARKRGIPFTELPQSGVVRRLRDRDGWADTWEERMAAPLVPTPSALRGTDLSPGGLCTHAELGVPPNDKLILPGGESVAHGILDSFLTVRGVDYQRELSSPLTAEESCSRLSAPSPSGPSRCGRSCRRPGGASRRSGVNRTLIPAGCAPSAPSRAACTGTATSSSAWNPSRRWSFGTSTRSLTAFGSPTGIRSSTTAGRTGRRGIPSWTPACGCCTRRAGSTSACARCSSPSPRSTCGCTGGRLVSSWRGSGSTTNPASTGRRCRCKAPRWASTASASTRPPGRRGSRTRMEPSSAAGCRNSRTRPWISCTPRGSGAARRAWITRRPSSMKEKPGPPRGPESMLRGRVQASRPRPGASTGATAAAKRPCCAPSGPPGACRPSPRSRPELPRNGDPHP